MSVMVTRIQMEIVNQMDETEKEAKKAEFPNR